MSEFIVKNKVFIFSVTGDLASPGALKNIGKEI